MVYYYFGSKDGLVVEIVRRGLKEIHQGLLRTREAVRRNELSNPTRSIIAEFAKVYNQRPALTRILISEVFREDSAVRNYFVRQRPAHGREMLMDVITQLSAAGYYRKDIDIEGTCAMILSVVFFTPDRETLCRVNRRSGRPLPRRQMDRLRLHRFRPLFASSRITVPALLQPS